MPFKLPAVQSDKFADITESEIGELFFCDESGGEIAVLVRAYLDDSSDGLQAKVFVAAGFVANLKDWRKARLEWKKRLRHHRIDYFKGSECKAVRGTFEKFRDEFDGNIPAAKAHCDAIRDDLKSVIQKNDGLIGFAHAIDLRDFREIDGGIGKNHPLWEHDHYLAGFKLAIASAAYAVMRLRHRHLIGFVCDSTQKEYKFKKAYDSMKARYPDDIGDRMRGVSFLDDKITPALQMADLAADVSREVVERYMDSGELQSIHTSRLPGTLVSVELFDKEAMLKCFRGEGSFP